MSEPPGESPTLKVYAPPVTVLQLNCVDPPVIVVPGGGFVITAAFGAVLSVVIAVALVVLLDPVIVPVPVIPSGALVPAAHPPVATDTEVCVAAVCADVPATAIAGCPISVAHVPDSPNVTAPLKLA